MSKMNRLLREIAATNSLDTDNAFDTRIQFGLRCVDRTRSLIEDERALEILDTGLLYPADINRAMLDAISGECSKIASSHRGSASIDGSGHAAVSATYGLARALSGDAWHAAEYAAYALAYSYAGYTVTDESVFAPEYAWQCKLLEEMIGTAGG